MIKEEFLNYIEKNNWKFANNYKDFPHEYIFVDNCCVPERICFEDAVSFIRLNGVREKFFKKTFIYFYCGEYKYWTMGNPINITKVINRCFIDDKKNNLIKHFIEKSNKKHKTLNGILEEICN